MEGHSTITNCFCVLIPKLTYKYTYFIWFLLGALLRKAIPDILSLYLLEPIPKKNGNSQNGENKKDKDISSSLDSYLNILLNIISDLLTGIFLLVFKNSEKKSNIKNKLSKQNSLKINFIFNDQTPKAPLFYKLILLISFIDLISQSVFLIKNIITDTNENYSNGQELNYNYLYSLLIIDISARYFFSRYILNTHFYAHQKLSFILILFVLPFLAYIDILQIINYSNDGKLYINILIVILATITYILYSFEDVMDKVALETLFIVPNSLLFYKGLFQLIPFAIITLICYFCKLIDFQIMKIKEITEKLLIRASFIPFNILRNIHLVKVIDRFSAQHISHLRILENLIIFYFVFIFDKLNGQTILNWSKTDFVLGNFSLLILLLSSLIHNEIIIINSQVFREKTNYFLGKDAIKEQDALFDGDSESKDVSSSTISGLYSDVSSNY